ncbi:MAG: YcxB family protein [Oscillospiraceae bacterium]|nr:YcxB family protein [Oscillospiraceae bacterium]
MQFRAELDYTLQDMRQFEKLHQLVRSRAFYIISKLVMALGVILMLVSGGLLLYYGAFNGELLFYYLLVLVVLILYFALREIRARAALKVISAQGTVALTANEENVRAEAKGLSTVVEYTGYTELVHYKDAYYLYVDKRKAQILPERCFTEGDPAAFGAFIERKTGLTIKEIK